MSADVIPVTTPNSLGPESDYAGTSLNAAENTKAKGKRGGRLPKEESAKREQELSIEEKQKREKRRQHNLQAAARYRQKKDETIKQLHEEIEAKEETIAAIEEHNRNLRAQLEDALQKVRELEDQKNRNTEHLKFYSEKLRNVQDVTTKQRAVIEALKRERSVNLAPKQTATVSTQTEPVRVAAVNEPASPTTPSRGYSKNQTISLTTERHNETSERVSLNENGASPFRHQQNGQKNDDIARAAVAARMPLMGTKANGPQPTLTGSFISTNNNSSLGFSSGRLLPPPAARQSDTISSGISFTPTLNQVLISDRPSGQLKLPIQPETPREDPLAFLRASRPRPGIGPVALAVPKSGSRPIPNRKGRPRLDEVHNQSSGSSQQSTVSEAPQPAKRHAMNAQYPGV